MSEVPEGFTSRDELHEFFEQTANITVELSLNEIVNFDNLMQFVCANIAGSALNALGEGNVDAVVEAKDLIQVLEKVHAEMKPVLLQKEAELECRANG